MEKIIEAEYLRDVLKEYYPLISPLSKQNTYGKRRIKNNSIISLVSRKVRYCPDEHIMESGEAVYYFNVETCKVEKGIIENVRFLFYIYNNFYPVYKIKNKEYARYLVWPNIKGLRIQRYCPKIRKDKYSHFPTLILSMSQKRILGI